MTNVEQYLNRDKNTCTAIPKRVSNCLQVDNFLSEYDTDEERELAMLNLLLLDTKPTEGSTKLVNSGDLYNEFQKYRDELEDTLQELSENFLGFLQDINNNINQFKNLINNSLTAFLLTINNSFDNYRGEINNNISQLSLILGNKISLNDITISDLNISSEEELIYDPKVITLKDENGNTESFNIIILRKVAVQYYYIDYDTSGGNNISRSRVKQGDPITNLPTPTKTQHRFEGWYIKGNSGTDLIYFVVPQDGNFGFVVNRYKEGLNVFAYIKKITVQGLSNKEWDLRTSEELPIEFYSDHVSIGSTDCYYTSGNFQGLCLLTSNNTVWKTNINGLFLGSGDRTIGILDLKAGDIVKIDIDGNVKGSANGVEVKSTSLLTVPYTPISNVDLLAKWYKIYTVTFINGSSITTQQGIYGTIINLPSLTKENYIFVGWSDGDNIYEGETFFTITGDITLSSLWNSACKYYLATEVLEEEPELNSATSDYIEFKDLVGWDDWEGSETQYIVVPAKSGKTLPEDYILVIDSLGNSGMEDTFEYNLVGNLVYLKWTGFIPLNNDGDNTAKIKFII